MAYLYRADHVGQLVPTTQLESTSSEALNAAVQALIALQKQTDIGVVTDGGIRRASITSMFVNAVSGVQSDAHGAYVASKLSSQSRLVANEVEFLKTAASGKHFKVFLPSPTVAAMALQRDGQLGAYASTYELALALAEVIRREIEDLIAQGVRYVQLNCPAYELMQNGAAFGFESLEQVLAADAAAVKDVQKTDEVWLAAHLPRPTTQASNASARAKMIETAFARLPVDRYLIEFDNQLQDTDFAPLRALPPKKIAVLGLIDPINARVDEVDPVLDKLDAAGKFGDIANYAISPQRGFSQSSALSHEQTVKAQKNALMLTAETAHRYWGIEL